MPRSRHDRVQGEPCRRNARQEFRSTKCGDDVDILRCQVRAAVEGPFVSEYLRLLGLRDHRDFVSGMEVRQDRVVRMPRETQAHTAKRGHPLILIIHAHQLDFVSDAPGQSRGLVSQRAMPSQGRMQINLTCTDEA